MANVTMYFDPVCPWAWRAFLWLLEVRKVRPLEIQYGLFSLKEINRGDDPLEAEHAQSDAVFRTLVLARRSGGEEAVEKLYLALGEARHTRRENLKDEAVIEAALDAAGLDRSLLRRALDDPSTDQEALAEHRASVERYEAFGVPWLVLEGQSSGLYGPVISEVPTGEAAAELWEHTAYFLRQPYFWELKRERP